MSFISKLKSWFGSGRDPVYADNPPVEIDHLSAKPPHIDPDEPIEVPEEMMMMIFDKVVEVTNASLPGYLSSSVNAEKQKKYLYDALDMSVKKYLAELDSRAQAKCMALWQNDHDELKRQIETQKQRAADFETKRNEMNEQRLSSENQRRALTERVRVLEETNLKLEAEKEQYEIENRGLINKVKVVQVYETDIENMRQELEMLRASVSPEAESAEVEKLQGEIGQLNEKITNLENEKIQLQNNNADLKESIDASKIKTDMSDLMINDLQKRTAELQHTVRESEKNTAELNEIVAVKDARIADLNLIIEEQEARLTEFEEMITEYETLAEQMDKFEDVKSRLQGKIGELKEDLTKAHQENEKLRTDIESNLNDHAKQEQAMQHTIEQLRNRNQAPLSGEDLSIDSDTL